MGDRSDKLKIANVVLNDFTRDNRVLKITLALTEMGHHVSVGALHRQGMELHEMHPKGFEIVRMTIASPQRKLFAGIKWLELAFRFVRKFRKYDVWHCNDVEAFAFGILAKLTRPKLKLVYDCHEFESERNAKPFGMNPLTRVFEELFIQFAEEVFTVSPSIFNAYKTRYKKRGLKQLSLLRNVPNKRIATGLDGPLRKQLGLTDSNFIAIYQGALTWNRGVETLLKMSERLKGTNIHLVFMGYGPLESAVVSLASVHSNIHFQPAVQYEQVLDYTGDADLGLVSVNPVCLSYRYCLPNKLFESIQAGIPVLVNSLPDCVQLIETFGIGKEVRQNDSDGWFEAIEEASKKEPAWKTQAQSGFLSAQEALNWETEVEILKKAYARLQTGLK